MSLDETRSGSYQGWGQYYSGTRPAQNDKHEYTKKNLGSPVPIVQYSWLPLSRAIWGPKFASAS